MVVKLRAKHLSTRTKTGGHKKNLLLLNKDSSAFFDLLFLSAKKMKDFKNNCKSRFFIGSWKFETI